MRALLVASLAGAAIVVSSIAPGKVAHATTAPSAPMLGGFAIGDGLEATISEADGALALVLPLGGLGLGWDSRQAGSNRHGLGDGWAWHAASVDTSGGVRVFPASGGVFEHDASRPSGLAGYPAQDVVFEAASDVLPGRADATGRVDATGPRRYAYRLHELGGRTTYFDVDGDAIALVDARGDRTDLVWDADVPHRLLEVVSPEGLVTGLEWSAQTVVVRPARNATAAGPRDGAAGEWMLSLEGGRVAATVDPVGTRTVVRHTPDGLLTELHGATGAATHIDWRAGAADDVTRVDRVRVVSDTTGRELSMRRWLPGRGGALPSGWPTIDDSHGEAATAYETVLSDGATRIASSYDHRRRLERRAVHGVDRTGSVELQAQRFTYPDDEGSPSAASVAWSRPTSATVTYTDPSGASRSTTASFGYDDEGRIIDESRADGTRIETRYDETVAEGSALPIGLPVLERTTGADGLIAETRHTLTADRSAVASTETWSGTTGEGLVRTGRTEYTVGTDGFVTEQRRLALGGSGAPPITTRWSRAVDAASGTQTLSETVAAGTSAEATSTRTASLVHGGVLRETDAVGRTVTAAYDAAGRVVEQLDAVGAATRTSYATVQRDGLNAVTVTGPDGVSVTEVSDELGRMTELHDNIDGGRPADGHVRVAETRTYPAPGTLAVTDAWGATTTTSTDAFGRVVATEQPTGLTEVVRHDDVAGTATAGLTSTGDLGDAGLTTTQRLDDAGRPVVTTGTRTDGEPVPAATRRYDGLGRIVASSDGVRETAVTYDELGSPATTAVRPVAGDEPPETPATSPVMTSQRRFDGFGRSLEKVLAADDEARSGGSRELDALGRTVAETDQAGRVTRTTYTVDGLVARVDDASGAVEEYTYDPLTRAPTGTRTTSPTGATVTTAIESDSRTGEPVSMYDPDDRAGTELTWQTDAFGNTTSIRYPDGAEIRHEYDPHGRRLATVDTAGNRTEFAYDRAGRLVTAVQRAAAGAELTRVGYEYDELGRMHRLTRGNGVTTEYSFTSAGELAREITTRDGKVHADRSYEYSPSGLVLHRVDRTRGDDGALRATTTAYTYDLLDRLTRSSVHDGDTTDAVETRRTDYTVTVSGDIAAETVTEHPGAVDETTSTREFEYSPLGELTAITTDGSRSEQEFDAAGSLVRAADGTRYEYDAANRLVAATAPDGEVTRTDYWVDGSRRSQTSAEGTTGFYWDGTTLVNDVHADANGARLGFATYLLGAERHARSTVEAAGGAIATEYSTLDRHGNVAELTDEAGEVSAEYTYTDYGVVSESPRTGTERSGLHRNPFRYAGEFTDRDGRQHLQTRLYDARHMRFDRRDRAALHNRYAYADLNPISKIDPTGRTAWLDWLNVAATGLSSVLSVAGGASAITAFVSMATGGAALTLFGIAAVGVGLADAAFAGFQVANTLSATKWMDETATTTASWIVFGAGIGLAAAGIVGRKLLGAAGKAAEPLDPASADPVPPAPLAPDDLQPFMSAKPSIAVAADAQTHAKWLKVARKNMSVFAAQLEALSRLKADAIQLEAGLHALTTGPEQALTKSVLFEIERAEHQVTAMFKVNAKMKARGAVVGADWRTKTRERVASNTHLAAIHAHLARANQRVDDLNVSLSRLEDIPSELHQFRMKLAEVQFGLSDYLKMF